MSAKTVSKKGEPTGAARAPVSRKDKPTGAARTPGPRKSRQPTLTKRDLVVQIAERNDLSQDRVHQIVQQLLESISDALEEGRRVEFRDFGVFEVALRRSRVGRNPNRPENTVLIPEHQVVRFKPGKRMKQRIASL